MTSLTDEISNFGSLVGLMLALAALLTANRASGLATLKKEKSTVTASERRREMFLDLLLATVTALTFLGGLPLVVRAINGINLFGHEGPIRSVLIMVWVLLAGLIVFQFQLARSASKLKLS
jgi:hypothetical protein